MESQTAGITIESLSSQLAEVVERAGKSVVRVDDGSRLTASGLVWSADGLIVTTSHGTERDDDLAVITAGDDRLAAKLIGRDEETDLALLRVEGGGLAPLAHADEAAVRVGQIALALGRPGTAGLQATLGIVGSRQEMEAGGGRVEYLIGTDATLYPGFSGGPLMDAAGNLLGINNRGFGRGQSVALGVTLVGHVVETLLKTGGSKRGYLGVSTQAVDLPEALRASLAVPQASALLIVQLADGGPAERAGMTLGDSILGVDEHELGSVDDLRRYLRSKPAGEQVHLRIVRGGEIKDVDVTLGALS